MCFVIYVREASILDDLFKEQIEITPMVINEALCGQYFLNGYTGKHAMKDFEKFQHQVDWNSLRRLYGDEMLDFFVFCKVKETIQQMEDEEKTKTTNNMETPRDNSDSNSNNNNTTNSNPRKPHCLVSDDFGQENIFAHVVCDCNNFNFEQWCRDNLVLEIGQHYFRKDWMEAAYFAEAAAEKTGFNWNEIPIESIAKLNDNEQNIYVYINSDIISSFADTMWVTEAVQDIQEHYQAYRKNLPFIRPVTCINIWCNIIYVREFMYPLLNEINYDLHYLANNNYEIYPMQLKYSQIPGYHILVGYTYKDFFGEFSKYTQTNEINVNENKALNLWFYRKLCHIVSRFVLSDFNGITRNKSNYALKLQSILTHSDLMYLNLYTSVVFPLLTDPKVWFWNVCVYIGLSPDETDFIPEVWKEIDEHDQGFVWNGKMPLFVRACTKTELEQYEQ